MVQGFQEVAAAELPGLAAWLTSDEAEAAEFDPPEWLAIVQMLTFRINYAARHGISVDWAVASDAYARAIELAERSGIMDRKEIAVRALNLTSALVHAVGLDKRITLLNPTEAMRQFFETIPMSPSEAREQSKDWQKRDISVIRRLRVAKSLVRPSLTLKSFMEDAETRSVLSEWDAIYSHLP